MTDLGESDFFLSSVPGSSLLSFWSRPTAEKSASLETISLSGEGRKTYAAPLFGADYLWSPNGEYALVSGSDAPLGKGLSLRVIGSDGAMKNLSIPTLISKAVWSKDNHTLYYALPGSLPENSVLPNEYFDKPLHSKDTFWSIDISTGKKTRLVELKDAAQVFDSSDLFLSPKEDALYFTDRVKKRLYRIDL